MLFTSWLHYPSRDRYIFNATVTPLLRFLFLTSVRAMGLMFNANWLYTSVSQRFLSHLAELSTLQNSSSSASNDKLSLVSSLLLLISHINSSFFYSHSLFFSWIAIHSLDLSNLCYQIDSFSCINIFLQNVRISANWQPLHICLQHSVSDVYG